MVGHRLVIRAARPGLFEPIYERSRIARGRTLVDAIIRRTVVAAQTSGTARIGFGAWPRPCVENFRRDLWLLLDADRRGMHSELDRRPRIGLLRIGVRAGETVDPGGEKVGDSLDKTGDKIEDWTKRSSRGGLGFLSRS